MLGPMRGVEEERGVMKVCTGGGGAGRWTYKLRSLWVSTRPARFIPARRMHLQPDPNHRSLPGAAQLRTRPKGRTGECRRARDLRSPGCPPVEMALMEGLTKRWPSRGVGVRMLGGGGAGRWTYKLRSLWVSMPITSVKCDTALLTRPVTRSLACPA